MKKILLLSSTLFLGMCAFAQPTCPTISGIHQTNIVNNGNGTCSATIAFHVSDNVPNLSGVKLQVFCGSSTTAVLEQCFSQIGSERMLADYTSNSFTCPCNVGVTVRFTPYLDGNGDCLGTACPPIEIQQSPLPVSFVSFTARRNLNGVGLNWQTATEINNKGFAIEKRIGENEWKEINFVTSQALYGNSTAILNYQYHDVNNLKGVTQYRLKQVDLDGKSSYSEVRSVRGEGQIGKVIIFPNPSNDGKVKLVFEDASAIRDITVTDMSGRTVKMLKGITSTSLEIDNLAPGMYGLKVIDRETSEQIFLKVLVNKR